LIMPGIEDRLLASTGEIDVREDVFSLVEVLRWEEDLCRRSLSLSLSLSCLLEESFELSLSFFSRRLSALFSRTLEGMTVLDDWHVAVHFTTSGAYLVLIIWRCQREWLAAQVGACGELEMPILGAQIRFLHGCTLITAEHKNDEGGTGTGS
jgi:hypothetical protein